jgi:hypothetical protein
MGLQLEALYRQLYEFATALQLFAECYVPLPFWIFDISSSSDGTTDDKFNLPKWSNK